MAIAFEGYTTGTSSSTSITMDSWTIAADELILLSVTNRGTGVTPTASGNGITFTQINLEEDTQGVFTMTLFRGMASSGDTGSITVTLTGNSDAAVAIAARFSGVDTSGTNGSGAIDAWAVADEGASDNDDAKVTVTTTVADAVIAGLLGDRLATYTTPGGQTNIIEDVNEGSGGGLMYSSASYDDAPTTGDYTMGGDASLSSNREWIFYAISMKPEGNALSLAGTLTSSGAVTKEGQLDLAGAISTITGAIVGQGQKLLSGTLSSAGSPSRDVTTGTQAGTLSSAGAVFKMPGLSAVGTLTSAGAVSSFLGKFFSGTLTSAGTVATDAFKVLAGTLTSAGTVGTILGKLFAGTLTSAGALVRDIGFTRRGGLWAFKDKILDYAGDGMIVYFPMDEDSTEERAYNALGDDTFNGIYSGVTLEDVLGPDGATYAGTWGSGDYMDFRTDPLEAAFNGDEGTVIIFGKTGSWGTAYEYFLNITGNIIGNSVTIWKGGISNRMWVYYEADGTTYAHANITSTTDWFSVAITWSHAKDELRRYMNGIQTGGTATGLNDWTATGLYNTSVVAGATNNAGNNSLTGSVAHLVIFDRPLSPEEIAEISTITKATAGVVIKETATALVGTLTSAGAVIKETATALVGTLTSSGSVSSVINYVQSLAGTLTSAGSMAWMFGRSVAGTLTSAGDLTRKTALTFTGTLSTAGDALKGLFWALSGTLASSGNLDSIKVLLLSLSGTLTSAGALVNKPLKYLSGVLDLEGLASTVEAYLKSLGGTLTSSGLIDIQLAKILSGVLSSSGTLSSILSAFRSFGGTLTSAGSVVKRAGTAFSGTLTSSGVVSSVVGYVQALAGTLSSAGEISSVLGRILSGTLTTAGSLVRETAVTYLGGLYTAGTLVRETATALVGTLTSSGTVDGIKVALVALAGTLTSAGNLARETATALAGTLTSSGAVTLVKSLLLALSGAVSSSGQLTRRTLTDLAGTLTSSGVVSSVVAYVQSLGGTLTSSGTVATVSDFVRAFSGTLTSAGALVRDISINLAGNLSSSGIVSRIHNALEVIILTLWTRSPGLTLLERTTEMTLRIRSAGLTLSNRVTDLTLRVRSSLLSLIQRD